MSTRALAPERDAARPADLAPLSLLDRLALATGLHLMLWSARHAERSASTARRFATQQQLHAATRHALQRGAGLH